MADINSLPYFVYSLMTLASHDVPTTDPALRAWQPDPPVNEAWDQEPYDITANYPPMTRFPEEDADFPTAYTDEYKEIYPTDPPPNEDEVYFDRRRETVQPFAERDPEYLSRRRVNKAHDCPTHEHYDVCQAYQGCQKNCDNYKENKPCPLICVSGCICDEGFIRGPNKKCIRPESCPAKENAEVDLDEEDQDERYPRHRVDPDEEYQTEQYPGQDTKCPNFEVMSCEKGCERNCSNWDRPKLCPKMCIRGCVCRGVLVRGPKGKCIGPKMCPKESQVIHQEPQPGILRASNGCPDNDNCTVYCKKYRGKPVGSCQGFQRMECLCFEHW